MSISIHTKLKQILIMKKLNLFIVAAALLLSGTSCVENSSAYKKLQAQYDSLLLVSNTADSNLEEMLGIINEVEQSLQEIKDAEQVVNLKRQSNELTATTREEIRSNMQFFTEQLKQSREKIDRLNEELRKNRVSSKALAQKIKQITETLQQCENDLNTLRQELAAKDIRIGELTESVEGLSRDVEELTSDNQAKADEIRRQADDLHTAYYCFGSAAELKKERIITGGGIFSSAKVLPDNFNRDYFLSIDTREVTSIPLYAPKARVRTSHPASSYEFVKGDDGNMTIHILNAKEFWSASKYLVIEVNL